MPTVKCSECGKEITSQNNFFNGLERVFCEKCYCTRDKKTVELKTTDQKLDILIECFQGMAEAVRAIAFTSEYKK